MIRLDSSGKRMIFLIEYDRRAGELLRFQSYADESLALAQKQRLELELDLNRRQIEHEVVILEATSEEALRKTHARYFLTAAEIAASLAWPQ